ncbi:MAG: hypothetical protein Q4E50_03290 [Tissierellia bacterium]|nr:hypothetical protein [Tissierellia bacterium]
MRSIFELISKYKSDVIIVPIIAFVALVITVFMYIFFNKKKIYKYIPAFITLLVGLVLFFTGFSDILEASGLNYIELGAKFLVFAFVAIIFSLILDTFDSLVKNVKKKNKKSASNKKVQNKKSR